MAHIIPIDTEMLKRLVAAYTETAFKTTQNMVVQGMQYDRKVGGRMIDIWGRLSWGVLFVSVLLEEPSESYMEEYRRLCERHLVEEAWLVYPRAEPSISKLPPKTLFENKTVYGVVKTVSLDHVFEGLSRYFRAVFSVKNEQPILTLDWKEGIADAMATVI